MPNELTPALLLSAYAQGIFPMAENRNSEQIHWYSPHRRGILPLDGFHVPKKLERLYKKRPFEIRINTAFEQVIEACAERNKHRPDTWINDIIINAYIQLHRLGYAHSVECWRENRLAGGLYGVSLGGAFCGESMFSRETNASKIALIALVERLREKGFALLDTQYINDHLKQFGAIEIPKEEYLEKLNRAAELRVGAFFI